MSNNLTTEYLQLVDELVDEYNIPNHIIDSLMAYVKPLYRSDLENKYSVPMFSIGMYIVFASLVCVLAMVADLLHGLRSKKLWFPCKYFRMNAAFLSIMFVAMKLPVDLSGVIPGDVDEAGKLGSMAFMCIMMANLLPCLATMGSNELLSNITALCVLVITLVVNVCIQIQTGVVSYNEDSVIQIISPKYDVQSLGISKHRNTLLATIYMSLLVVLLMIHVCSSLAILKSKKLIESKYRQGHNIASKDIQQSPRELLTVEKLQKYVSNHWIMAGSGSPQFITACFRTTSASGVICVLVTLLHTLTMSWIVKAILRKDYNSDYSWSMLVILIVQSIGVVIGTIAPLSRCFAILSFKVSFEIISKHFKVFNVESYWTQKLYDWKHASVRLSFPSNKLKVVLLILLCCIRRNIRTQTPQSRLEAVVKVEKNKLVVFDNHGFNSFDVEDLLKASEEVLGEGSVGRSYKQVLEGKNVTVVVKRLKDVVVTENEFRTTMEVLGKMKNEYVVPLIGYYYSQDEKWLVYAYMDAGSLYDRLHGIIASRQTQLLDWNHRMRIAIGCAKGVAYLHEDDEKSVVHGNIHSSNILLQEKTNIEALVSDYGLNTLFDVKYCSQNHHGTGYWAPEVENARAVTFKSDVYSFGVLLLELLTSKIPKKASLGKEGDLFSKLLESVVCGESNDEIFDVGLRMGHNIEEMRQFLQIAKECLSIEPNQRPSMKDVVRKMEVIWPRQLSDDHSKGSDYTPSTETGDTPSTITYDTPSTITP